MKFETVTNAPSVRIGFARSYSQLPDEYRGADMYSNFLGICFTQACRDRKAAKLANKQADATVKRSEAELNSALAQALGQEQPKGLSTGAMIGIGIGVIAVVGLVIYKVA